MAVTITKMITIGMAVFKIHMIMITTMMMMMMMVTMPVITQSALIPSFFYLLRAVQGTCDHDQDDHEDHDYDEDDDHDDGDDDDMYMIKVPGLSEDIVIIISNIMRRMIRRVCTILVNI